MKKLLILFAVLFCSVNSYSSELQKDTISNPTSQETIPQIGRYKIYPTSNMYNFIKLDTQKGLIYIVQWNTQNNKRFQTISSAKVLIDEYDDRVNGRFEIIETKNYYNFLVLDKISGKVWQYQWGFEPGDNMIVRIY